jgi:phosphoglycerate dehydrogenase-like enzyme
MKVVVDLHERRAIWAMPSWLPARLRDALPPGGEVVMLDVAADGSGDGVLRVDPRVLEAVRDADVYLGFGVSPELLRAADRLRWVHSASAGVGSSLSPEMLASPVTFTNSAGVHAPPIAETVLAMILHFARGLDLAARGQARARWESSSFYEGDAPVTEIGSSTVGVVGFGGIGRAVAERVGALGAAVLGLKRKVDGTGDVRLYSRDGVLVGAARVRTGPTALAELLGWSDFVVLCAPHTPETERLIDADALARMKPTAVLINVSRGALVDERALVEALRTKRIRGAALDVFASEPLPEGHPLWTVPNLLITPHVSAVTRGFWMREVDLIVENLRRLQAGSPLLNVVDKAAGY